MTAGKPQRPVIIKLDGDPLTTRRWTLHEEWFSHKGKTVTDVNAFGSDKRDELVFTKEMEYFNGEISKTIVNHVARKNNFSVEYRTRFKQFSQRDRPLLIANGVRSLHYLTGAIVVVLPIVSRLIDERASGVKQLLNLMGMSDVAYLFANYIFPFVCTFVFGIFLLNDDTFSMEHITMSPILPVFVLALAVINFCLHSLILSLFFNSSSSGVSVVVVLTFGAALHALGTLELTEYGPKNMMGFTKWDKLFLSAISPFTAYFLIIIMLCLHDFYGGGFKLNMIFKRLFDMDTVTVSELIALLIGEIFVLLIILLYLNHTLPWLSGTQKGWFFFLNFNYYFPAKAQSTVFKRVSHKNIEVATESSGEIIIECIDVSKQFGSREVLSNITMSMYDKEITVLLGQSGAGKTTLMNIITGLMPPTSGQIRICGRTIAENRALDSVVMSFCQQQSVYFPDLTVYEHLIFYSMMRNIPNDELDSSAQKAAEEVKLADKLNDFAENLSGGMKRRLCTAIAVLGDPKLIVLDEPTTGLDAETRNQLWDMLQDIRRGRCILLSTHDMEEADVLGDRIAVISSGKLGCYGTPYFLKKKFGSGYHIRLLKQTGLFSASTILSCIQNFVVGAKVQSETEAECIIQLGNIDPQTTLPLFKYLEDNKTDLNIDRIGVTVTTIEDVFVNFLEHAGISTESEQERDVNELEVKKKRVLEMMADRKPNCCQALLALFRKRVAYLIGWHWFTLTFCLLLYSVYFQIQRPVLFKLQNISLQELLFETGPFEDQERHNFSLKQGRFESATCYIKNNSTHFGAILLSLMETECSKVITVPENEEVDKFNFESFKMFPFNTIFRKIGVGFELREVNITYNDAFAEMKMVAQQTFYTALLRYITRDTKATLDGGFRLYEDLNRTTEMQEIEKLLGIDNLQKITRDFLTKMYTQFIASFIASVMVPLPFAIAVAFFVLMPITETNTQSKSLQILTGVQEIVYYLGHWLFDAILFLPFIFFYALLHLTIVTTVANPKFFVPFCIATFIYIWAILPMTYLVSHFVTTEGIGFTIMLLLTFIVHILAAFASFLHRRAIRDYNVFEIHSGGVSLDQLVMPTASYWKAVYRAHDITFYNDICLTAHDIIRKELCQKDKPLLRPSCCNGRREALSAYTDSAYITSLTVMASLGVVYFVALIAFEKGTIFRLFEPQKPVLPEEELDDDVVKEQKVADNIISKRDFNKVAMVAHELRKFFKPSTLAVAGLSFTVRPKECFGLLGVNGAGKTTAFQMLTGFIPLTSGEAYIGNDALHQDVKKFQRHVGYCPQYNGLLLRLTVWQMFQLFGALRGVNSRQLVTIIEDLSDLLELREHINKYCEDLSGGNKRKLSIGLAIIGQPEILFLDEPTAGVDIVAKKRILEFIDFAQENANMSVVLTSHALGECESVCDRVAIMVKGQFRCIGTLQHIKHKFGTGYTFNVKVTPHQKNDESFSNSLIAAVEKAYGGVTLRNRHLGIFLFHIDHSTRRSWSELFDIALQLQKTFGFEDFFLMDTTLQEIFCEFAKSAAVEAKMSTSSTRTLHLTTKNETTTSSVVEKPNASRNSSPEKTSQAENNSGRVSA